MWPIPDSDTTQLFLIRHGATEANERRPYILQGSGIDLPLSETGRIQAAAVGRFLAGLANVKAIYSSTLKRAAETASEIARHHGLKSQICAGIHEVDVGRWEGKSWSEIMEETPEPYEQFMADPGDMPYLDGESYRSVLNRTKPAIESLLEKHRGQTVIVVAHNVVNRAYLADLMGLDLRRAKQIHQANCCVNVIHHKNRRSELISLNSHFHVFTTE